MVDAVLSLGPTRLGTLGLGLDAAEVLLLCGCGLPSRAVPKRMHGMNSENWFSWGSEDLRRQDEKEYRLFHWGAHTGLALLLVGFALQIAANYAPAT